MLSGAAMVRTGLSLGLPYSASPWVNLINKGITVVAFFTGRHLVSHNRYAFLRVLVQTQEPTFLGVLGLHGQQGRFTN